MINIVLNENQNNWNNKPINERIEILKQKKIQQEIEIKRLDDDDPNVSELNNINRHIELLEAGFGNVKVVHHGIMVDDYYIFATRVNKWCVKGKYKWYRFTNVNDFIKKYYKPRFN